MILSIHQNIKEKLNYFYKIRKIPNILFHGPSGSGKSAIVNEFIAQIFENNKDKIKDYVMYVNCAHGKGIKFIREELKFFAKLHTNGDISKFIILLNGDKLTIDAQSALRRCIELFSHTTRFFIIVEDKYKLLKPILSRFSEIYVPKPYISNTILNLYKYNIEKTFNLKSYKLKRLDNLKKELQKINFLEEDILKFVVKLYEKGYSALDLMNLLENSIFVLNIDKIKKYELLITMNKVKKEIRNEKILMLFILNFIYLDRETDLTNISFM
jgi:DNA polymerase III delta prime subunit